MKFCELLHKINTHYNKNTPFALFSIPDGDTVKAYLQYDSTLYEMENYLRECFVFAPFNKDEKTFCIPSDQGEVITATFTKKDIEKHELELQENPVEKEQYCKLLNFTISTIKSRNAIKIVTSRKKDFKLKQFNLDVLIERLLNLYPSAFRYIWYHPKTGLWCGATPEVLVKTEGPAFTTMALAGTQIYQENIEPIWNHKEREEQQIVVDAIVTSLQKVTSVLKISKSFTQQAANIIHLRSDITGILKKGKTTLSTITSTLHPTPAVCGVPQNFVNNFILNNENYNREFYTGFLGPICEKESRSKLFVNLRCMKIENNYASLFVGGGITISSIPESEWEETKHKLHTMLQVIEPMLS